MRAREDLRRLRRFLEIALRRIPGRAWLLVVCVLFGLGVSRVSADNAQVREYEIKAAYLYKFIGYVDWPPQGLPGGSDTLTIGIIGENPFGDVLGTLNGKPAKGRKIVVKENASAAELAECQIIFVSQSARERVPEILEQFKDKKVLTISEVDGFAHQGGIINFIAEKNKVRFEINVEAAKRTGFSISSELLKLARVVRK